MPIIKFVLTKKFDLPKLLPLTLIRKYLKKTENTIGKAKKKSKNPTW